MAVQEEKKVNKEEIKGIRHPELSEDEQRLLTARRIQKGKKPEFRRQESWRYKRVHPSWRQPKGIDSKMRLKMGGRPKSVEIGYGSPSRIRGRSGSGHVEVLVFNVEDLSKVTPSQVVKIAHVVGRRKRVGILEKAKALELYVVNPGRVGEVES